MRHYIKSNSFVEGVRIVNKSKFALPSKGTSGSSGFDLRSTSSSILKPGERTLIKTGVYLDIPLGYEVQIRPRSGLALKHGIGVLNSPGTVDSDYSDEIGIILINQSKDEYFIKEGDRIAQMVFSKVYEPLEWVEVDDIENGRGGFGSTGK